MSQSAKTFLAMSDRTLRTLAADPSGRATLERGLRQYLFERDDLRPGERARLDKHFAKVQAALEQVPPPGCVEVKA